ncbi:hypothetical protein ELI49_33680 [Rhizobium ruizarguesonis]|jgi:hypothetical protein|uniref:Uncharacterized protein n=1 Tax=Rhizobium ruizarguesonis TaxID=2081791 RepID=A0AAE8TYX7_9HYPH|nr:hypothetical protein [Rhizobium ruizarguesonis]QIO49448.1 hypothetical protein HA464_36625 [Rhizobium leguminosarum bv. trifolii]QJS32704.1 hypothetical protein RLTA1_36725 [Rhizobium leguminosarum bv. trifolii TA1]TAT71370.1 hypothetical protein ELI56_33925 [Rhizobium ruizarguesonis]TAT72496.1 hypothetical protein ELI52_33980 [Rhizobium ruizarguesonis]TAT81839.1 hypothetical protein ELI54_27030 [Rhizobium ruizarguesonis]
MKFSLSRMKKISDLVLLFSAFSCSYASETLADVPTHQALSLYGNAALTGLCRHLGINKQWVCELSDSPDIHLTFNAGTSLHITVRTPSCEGNSVLDGKWPGKLTIAPDQPKKVCNVKIVDEKEGGYLDRLNALPEIISKCEVSFQEAFLKNRLNAETANFYIGQCKRYPALPKTSQDEDRSE